MTFSWANQINKAEKMKIRREKNKALNPTKDYKIKYPDLVREASQGKFTMLEKMVREKLKNHVDMELARRVKRLG